MNSQMMASTTLPHLKDKSKNRTKDRAKDRAEAAPITIRMPDARDGCAIRQLIADSGTMDVNAEYAYMLLATHFRESCALAEDTTGDATQIAGFVSAYLLPTQPDTIFFWQIIVHSDYQQCGLARAMLHDILQRKICANLRYIHITIAASNTASRGLITSLARQLNAAICEQPLFPAHYFSTPHEAEPVFIIGPFTYTPQEQTV